MTYGIYVVCTSLSSMFFLKYNKITIIILISLCNKGIGFVSSCRNSLFIFTVFIFVIIYEILPLTWGAWTLRQFMG
jgi:hypothetical protein